MCLLQYMYTSLSSRVSRASRSRRIRGREGKLVTGAGMRLDWSEERRATNSSCCTLGRIPLDGHCWGSRSSDQAWRPRD